MKKLVIVNASYVYLSCQILLMVFHALDKHLMSCCYMQRHFVNPRFVLLEVQSRGRWLCPQHVGLLFCHRFFPFSWDVRDLPELTGCFERCVLVCVPLSLAGAVWTQNRQHVYSSSASVLNSSNTEIQMPISTIGSLVGSQDRSLLGTACGAGGEEVFILLGLMQPPLMSFFCKQRILHFRHCQIIFISKLEKNPLEHRKNRIYNTCGKC